MNKGGGYTYGYLHSIREEGERGSMMRRLIQNLVQHTEISLRFRLTSSHRAAVFFLELPLSPTHLIVISVRILHLKRWIRSIRIWCKFEQALTYKHNALLHNSPANVAWTGKLMWKGSAHFQSYTNTLTQCNSS